MNILDKRFQYTPSHATDIRKTFERIRLEQAAAQKRAPVSTPAWVKLLTSKERK